MSWAKSISALNPIFQVADPLNLPMDMAKPLAQWLFTLVMRNSCLSRNDWREPGLTSESYLSPKPDWRRNYFCVKKKSCSFPFRFFSPICSMTITTTITELKLPPPWLPTPPPLPAWLSSSLWATSGVPMAGIPLCSSPRVRNSQPLSHLIG